MHVVLTKDLKLGMAKMKFALNHKWKCYAYMAGLTQAIIIFLVAVIRYFVIIIFAEEELNIVKDFLALLVIAEVDSLFFKVYE